MGAPIAILHDCILESHYDHRLTLEFSRSRLFEEEEGRKLEIFLVPVSLGDDTEVADDGVEPSHNAITSKLTTTTPA